MIYHQERKAEPIMATITTEERIRDILLAHRGKANRISSKDIAEILHISRGPSSVSIRTLIKKTIVQFRMPVAGGNRGYYIIENNAEMFAYIHNIRSRINEMTDRLTRISSYYFGLEMGADMYDEDEDPEL